MKFNLKRGIKRNQAGFTLVELLLVVGIMALGAIVAYVTLPKVRSTSNANSEATSINTLAAGVKNVYAGSNSYSTLNNTVLINAKAVPDRMLTGETGATTGIVNGFGGAVVVSPTKLGGGQDNSAFQIVYNNVPSAECVKIATGVGNNFSQVSIGSSTPGTVVRAYTSTEPVDAAVSAAECNKTEANVITFINK